MSTKTKGLQVFDATAKLVKEKREKHPKNYSQTELSAILGYKNGQFISNVERGKCAMPLHKIGQFCDVLEVDENEMVQAMLADKEATIKAYFEAHSAENTETEGVVTPETTEAPTATTEAQTTTPSTGFGAV
jgi:hypothetical protein